MLTEKQVTQCLVLMVAVIALLVWLQHSCPEDGTYVCYDNENMPMLTIRNGQLINEDHQAVMEYSYRLGIMYCTGGEESVALLMIGGDDCLYTPYGETLFQIQRFERIW